MALTGSDFQDLQGTTVETATGYMAANSTQTFKNKKGKKMYITLVMAWNSGLDADYAKINTSSVVGGTIDATTDIHKPSDTSPVSNAYLCCRSYEISITSDTFSFSLVKSACYYNAVFV